MLKQPNFICLEGTGYGATEFTIGNGGKFVSSREEMYSNTTLPMCWAGLFKPEFLRVCQTYNLKFYNFDSAYFGNKKAKVMVRLTVNGFQYTEKIISRPADRWEKLKINLENYKQGSDIVIVPPDRKTCNMLNMGTPEEWVDKTVTEIKKYSDRNIRIRSRPQSRTLRTTTDTFKDFIKNNTYCVVGHSSNALVEAAMCNIPVISLGFSAVKSLYDYKISDIENLLPMGRDKKMSWLHHLSYCQFNREELLSGYAWEIINN